MTDAKQQREPDEAMRRVLRGEAQKGCAICEEATRRLSGTQAFDPQRPELGWVTATPLPEPRIWKLWRWLRLMR